MKKPSELTQPGPDDDKFERWTAQRKAAVILEVLKGTISVPASPCFWCKNSR